LKPNLINYLYQEELYRVTPPVVVIFSRPWHRILDEEKTLLAKILGSVKLTIDAVSIRHMPELSIDSLQALRPAKVLIFGSAINPGISGYEHNVVSGVSVIRADELGELDDTRKKSLWTGLKQMFGV
jgi:hypothetical protein